MYPPIFTLCASKSDVTDLLGTDPVRIFAFDEAPQPSVKPYAVWQTASGNPENTLSCIPDHDNWGIQVDVYADTVEEARTCAEKIRDAVEPEAYISSWRGESRDPQTNNYRYSFDIQFLTQR